MTGRLRAKAVRSLMTVLMLTDTIKSLEGKEDPGSLMAKGIMAMTAEYGKTLFIRYLKLEVALKHPNWDNERFKLYMLEFTECVIQEYKKVKRKAIA